MLRKGPDGSFMPRQRQVLQATLAGGLRLARDHAKRTRPYRPQTNGKVERFIRTLLERWASAYPYAHERQRQAALAPALAAYNRFRPHHALSGQTPPPARQQPLGRTPRSRARRSPTLPPSALSTAAGR
jgi:transposase InsO family protein